MRGEAIWSRLVLRVGVRGEGRCEGRFWAAGQDGGQWQCFLLEQRREWKKQIWGPDFSSFKKRWD